MPEVLKATLTALVTFAVLDGVWLGLVMNAFYRVRLSPIARMADGRLAPVWTPALAVYVLLAVGVAVFVVPRAHGAADAARFGALFGVVCFGVYDLTNYATLAAWPLAVTVVDVAWGACSCAAASAVTRTWLS